MKQYKKPDFVYVARKPCGCVVGLVNDEQDDKRFTAQAVANFIKDGLAVSREVWQRYTDEISKEPTFMDCPHTEQSENVQATLFGAAA